MCRRLIVAAALAAACSVAFATPTAMATTAPYADPNYAPALSGTLAAPPALAAASLASEITAVELASGSAVGWTVSTGFAPVALGVAAFSAGVLIGYTGVQVFEHFFGNAPSIVISNASIASVDLTRMTFQGDANWTNGPGPGATVYALAFHLTNGGLTGSPYNCTTWASGTSPCDAAWRVDAANHVKNYVGGTLAQAQPGSSNCTNGICRIARWYTNSQVDELVPIDLGPTTYANQTHAYTYHPGTARPNPDLAAARTRIATSSAGTQNFYNHALDPTNWAAPSADYDASSNVGDPGGMIWDMPDCAGLSVDGCESAITSAAALSGKSISFTVITADTADANVARDLVLATSPSVASHARPSTITITKNPSSAASPGCTTTTDWPHWSTSGSTVLAKGWVTCNYTGVAEATMNLWSCADVPSPDQAQLDAGGWGCSLAATTVKAVPVRAAIIEGPVYCPDLGAPAVAGDAYFIAQTNTVGGTPSWSAARYVSST